VDTSDFPGTERHRRVLRAVVAHYADDPRVLAVLVFGSLVRGNWDRYSDLDLDVVIADDARFDIMHELRRLCDSFAAIGERAAVVVPKRVDEGDVVLASLLELSIRYHTLATTSPNIVDSLRLLWGRIDEETARAAGRVNRRPDAQSLEVLCGRCLRSLVEADVALQRRRLWFAVEHLNAACGAVIEAFGTARGAARPLRYFQGHADESLQARLGGTLPGSSLASAQRALMHVLDLVEHELGTITSGRVSLTAAQREMLGQIRARQAAIVFE
jgi:predicted nucleotidyltransferase